MAIIVNQSKEDVTSCEKHLKSMEISGKGCKETGESREKNGKQRKAVKCSRMWWKTLQRNYGK